MSTFEKKCKIINLNYEYPGYTGEEQWALITDLTEPEIITYYSKQTQNYKPFIILSSSYGELRNAYIRNENKHYSRSKKRNNFFDFSEHTEEHHPEIQSKSAEERYMEKEQLLNIYASISKLHPAQLRCIIKYFFQRKSLHQISIEENKAYSTIYESYRSALKILKQTLEPPSSN